jgi:A/G-specific adenine glycosylase
LRWYRQNGRHDLPWRRTRDPWAVLLAELMLQRTRADLVVPVYEETLRQFETPAALAQASGTQVEQLFRPLGLHHRALRIQAAAAAVQTGVPRTPRQLLQIPGVGPYAASATLCFAFRRRVAIIDPNIIRVLDRLFSVRSDHARPRTDPTLWAAADALLPAHGAPDWNSALLDLGTTICTKEPHCAICPLQTLCPTGMKTLSGHATSAGPTPVIR